MSIVFDYKCEFCKQKKGCLYFNKENKKWYCKDHSMYLKSKTGDYQLITKNLAKVAK